jgi:hypothetical protein
MVGSAVERLNDLGFDELLGRHLEVVGVALDRLESRAAGFLSSRSKVLAETGVSPRRGSAGVSRSGCAVRWCRVG